MIFFINTMEFLTIGASVINPTITVHAVTDLNAGCERAGIIVGIAFLIALTVIISLLLKKSLKINTIPSLALSFVGLEVIFYLVKTLVGIRIFPVPFPFACI